MNHYRYSPQYDIHLAQEPASWLGRAGCLFGFHKWGALPEFCDEFVEVDIGYCTKWPCAHLRLQWKRPYVKIEIGDQRILLFRHQKKLEEAGLDYQESVQRTSS